MTLRQKCNDELFELYDSDIVLRLRNAKNLRTISESYNSNNSSLQLERGHGQPLRGTAQSELAATKRRIPRFAHEALAPRDPPSGPSHTTAGAGVVRPRRQHRPHRDARALRDPRTWRIDANRESGGGANRKCLVPGSARASFGERTTRAAGGGTEKRWVPTPARWG